MKNRKLAIAITIVTSLCCLCLAVISCAFGGFAVAGLPFETTINGYTDYQYIPPTIGFVLIVVALFMVIVPAVVGFLTLRKPKDAAPVVVPPAVSPDEPLPPTS